MATRKTPPQPAPDTEVPERPADPLFNQSLEKGLAALQAFDAAHRSLSLGEVAERTGMTKGSAQRTIHTLQQLGYVGKHPQTKRFHLLPKVIGIGFNYLAGHPLIQVASPYLAQLSNASGETASVTEPVEQDMVYVAQLLTPKFIPVLTPVGMRIPMYCTSSGRAYLSMRPEAEVQALLAASHREARTHATLTSVPDILERIAECRRIGYAWNEEELFLGDMGLAAPIVSRTGQAIGAVHIAPPTSRWTMDEARKRLAPLVIECARAITSALPH